MMVDTKSFLLLVSSSVLVCQGFSPARKGRSCGARLAASTDTATYPLLDERTGKATGISFLPPETIERALGGSPVEKLKLEKDGTSAFVDVYEYARKIREGSMTWEEVEKADLESVRLYWTN
jgi:hypothetical protein